MALIYGTYYINGVLGAAKWPRKQGLMGKEVVDVTILDVSVDQMVDWAAGIGAGRAKLAVQILASLYNDRDWDSEGAPNIEMFVNGQDEDFARKGLDLETTAPHDLLEPYHFKNTFGGAVPYKTLSEPKTREIIETTFAGALLYGLSHPDEVEAWYENYLEDFNSNRDTYEKVGLGVSELPTLEQYFSNAEDIINLYVQESGLSLPMPNPKLLSAAKKVRNK
jgi:hypothetical protein